MNGADLVIDALAAAGVERAFGIPGVHALSLFEALRTSPIEFVGGRTEMASMFSADGYARATGQPTALLLSTGPGTLMALGGVLEAASAHDPVVVISSQIEQELQGRRRGAIHEIDDQLASVRPLVKWARRATGAQQLPGLVAEAVAEARRAPSGPVYLELPIDVLTATVAAVPLDASLPEHDPSPSPEALERCVSALDGARAPVIWAGGGVVRSGAFAELLALAERIDAPVACTYMGKGAIDARHPLFAGSACEEDAVLELVSGADALLCVGTELGSETTRQWSVTLPERTFQIDASPLRLGTSYATHPIVADARAALAALASRCAPAQREGQARAAACRDAIATALATGDAQALELLAAVRAATPAGTATAWDMTILGYWAGSAWPADVGRTFLYPLGSGTLGYALPAAVGAAAAGRSALAVTGDGGAMYGISELATIAEHPLPLTWLIVDDGGYGVLRHYQRISTGETFAVDLARPDFAAVASAFGIAATATTAATLEHDLAAALASGAPHVLVLEARLDPPPRLG